SEYLYGYTKAEAIGRKLEDLIVPPEMRKGVIAAIQNWLINGQPIPPDELSLMRKDGSRVAVYSSHVMLRNTEGEQELYCLDIDLSEQKQTEENLRQAVAINQALIDAIPDMIIRTSREGICLDAISPDNMKFLVSPEKFIGNSIFDFLPTEFAQERMYYIEQAFQTGKSQLYEYQILLNGEIHYQEARIVASGNNEAIVLIRDISDRKKLEQELNYSHDLRELLFNESTDALFLLDSNTSLIFAKNALFALVASSAASLALSNSISVCLRIVISAMRARLKCPSPKLILLSKRSPQNSRPLKVTYSNSN
ncbi:MAG: PAS domain-containing protein, partial [Pseudanabaena sp.]